MRSCFHREIHYILLACLGIFLLAQCRHEVNENDSFEVRVRLPEDPDMLHPIISKSILATEVETFIFSPMTAIDPVDLSLKPVLITGIPEPEIIEEGKYEGARKLSLEIRPEAVWDNGQPITVNDVIFTLKTVFLPGVPAASWRSTLNIIEDVIPDPDDLKKFSIIIRENYFRTIMIATNYEVYPEYHYDPELSLRNVSLAELISEDPETMKLTATDSSILAFIDNYQSAKFTRNEVVGSGPYTLTYWQDKLQIRLDRKSDWWGDQLVDEHPIFTANPSAIVYKIIPDEQTSLAAVKSDDIDVMGGVPVSDFKQMREDSNYNDKFYFFTPSFNRYYFMALNTKRPILSDPRVRLALAHLVEVDRFIEVLLDGMAIRTIGHIHPALPYYRKDLEPIPYDPEKARQLLEEAGWKDTNQNGIVDKVIDGKLVEFRISYLATKRAVGQQMALSLQENARKLGIDINVIQNDFREHLKSIKKRDFDIVAAAKTIPDGVVDPFQTWHSSNDTPEGDNWSGYGDRFTDSLIQVIRTTTDADARTNAYEEFQEALYRDQPFIFLLCPTEGIIISKRFKAFESDLKPGYHPNYFELTD